LEPRGSVRFPLGAAFLRAVRFTFFRSAVSVIAFVFAISRETLSLFQIEIVNSIAKICVSNALQLGEFFHQLFYAEPRKLYRKFRVFPVSFAPKDDAFTILGVAHALSAAKTG
jgi:hypothetical protein